MRALLRRHVGHRGRALPQARAPGFAGEPEPHWVLTLVPQLVYLLSGMWNYVRLKLSESTICSVSQKKTHVHADSCADKQQN